MKNSEEAIEKLFTGLRTAEPPAGMNQRIIAGLENHETALRRTTPRSSRLVWLAVPAAAVLVVSALIFQPWRQRTHNSQPGESSAKTAPAMPQPLVLAQTAPLLVRPTPAPRAVMRSALKADSKASTAAQDMDALAVEEMRAASQVAPPLPLSDQEKLLLRMTHKRTPIELAALSPAIRARHDAEEEASFEKFFEPPKPPAGSE